MEDDNRTKDELIAEIDQLKIQLTYAAEVDVKRREAEEKLKKSEDRYKNLTANMPLGLYRRTCGPEGKLIMVNPALVKMFGYDSENELNQVPVAMLYYYPEQCATFSKKLFAHREVIKEQLKMKRKDGSPIWIAVTATVICDENNTPIYFDGIMEDITDAKNAEEEALLRQQQLMQADKMISLGILVSGVAHEINNPNQFIVSHLAPLRKAWNDSLPILDRYYNEHGEFKLGGMKYSMAKKRLNTIYKNIQEGTDRIKHIVDELRDYAREHPADFHDVVDLNNVIRSALSLLQNLIKKSTKGFYVTYGKEMPPFIGDYQRIEQVIINLIQNACQSLESANGEISIVSEYNSDVQQVIFQVNDTGCGISDEDLKRIRDPFFTTKRSRGGTGLGLSICETIVSKHGGTLTFNSEVGEGTTVKMALPAAQTQTEDN